MNKPGVIIGIRLRRGDLCSSDGENLRRSRPRTIQESKEMLATEVGDDLGFLKQVILAILFDCDKMMNDWKMWGWRKERKSCFGIQVCHCREGV